MAGSDTTRHGFGPLLSILCLALGILAPSASTAAEPCKHLIITGNPEYPPYLWRDASDETMLIGANADLMQLVAKELGISGLRTVSPSLSNESLYFTMSHKSPCNSGDMRGRLSRAIYQLHKQATMNKLVESNIPLWRQQSSK